MTDEQLKEVAPRIVDRVTLKAIQESQGLMEKVRLLLLCCAVTRVSVDSVCEGFFLWWIWMHVCSFVLNIQLTATVPQSKLCLWLLWNLSELILYVYVDIQENAPPSSRNNVVERPVVNPDAWHYSFAIPTAFSATTENAISTGILTKRVWTEIIQDINVSVY